ncbi:MAG: hypothetical protein R3A44_44120 [Caldilineaceae bacterium]
MKEMTIQVPDPLAAEIDSVQDRLPEILAYGLHHLSPVPNEVYRYVLEFLVSQPSAAEIAEFAPTPSMQARVNELLEKNRMGVLTPTENQELDEYVRINHLITMLKARSFSLRQAPDFLLSA